MRTYIWDSEDIGTCKGCILSARQARARPRAIFRKKSSGINASCRSLWMSWKPSRASRWHAEQNSFPERSGQMAATADNAMANRSTRISASRVIQLYPWVRYIRTGQHNRAIGEMEAWKRRKVPSKRIISASMGRKTDEQRCAVRLISSPPTSNHEPCSKIANDDIRSP